MLHITCSLSDFQRVLRACLPFIDPSSPEDIQVVCLSVAAQSAALIAADGSVCIEAAFPATVLHPGRMILRTRALLPLLEAACANAADPEIIHVYAHGKEACIARNDAILHCESCRGFFPPLPSPGAYFWETRASLLMQALKTVTIASLDHNRDEEKQVVFEAREGRISFLCMSQYVQVRTTISCNSNYQGKRVILLFYADNGRRIADAINALGFHDTPIRVSLSSHNIFLMIDAPNERTTILTTLHQGDYRYAYAPESVLYSITDPEAADWFHFDDDDAFLSLPKQRRILLHPVYARLVRDMLQQMQGPTTIRVYDGLISFSFFTDPQDKMAHVEILLPCQHQ